MKLTPYPQGLAIACAAPPMQNALADKMEQAKKVAMRIAPVDTGQYKYGRVLLSRRTDPTGRLRKKYGRFRPLPRGSEGGFHVERGVRNGVAYARLVNKAPHAGFLEFGTRYMKRQRILGRAMDAIST